MVAIDLIQTWWNISPVLSGSVCGEGEGYNIQIHYIRILHSELKTAAIMSSMVLPYSFLLKSIAFM